MWKFFRRVFMEKNIFYGKKYFSWEKTFANSKLKSFARIDFCKYYQTKYSADANVCKFEKYGKIEKVSSTKIFSLNLWLRNHDLDDLENPMKIFFLRNTCNKIRLILFSCKVQSFQKYITKVHSAPVFSKWIPLLTLALLLGLVYFSWTKLTLLFRHYIVGDSSVAFGRALITISAISLE